MQIQINHSVKNKIMRTFKVPTREELDTKSQAITDNLKKKLGTVPNLYAVIGNSSNALEAYLNYSSGVSKGVFSNKEIEAIKLAVSQENNCAYCLAAHTAIAKMNGFTEAETLELRATTIADSRLKAITTLAAEITKNRGKASDRAIEQFYNEGFDDQALIDLISIVVDITFTNYTHRLTDVPVDFPAAKPIELEKVG